MKISQVNVESKNGAGVDMKIEHDMDCLLEKAEELNNKENTRKDPFKDLAHDVKLICDCESCLYIGHPNDEEDGVYSITLNYHVDSKEGLVLFKAEMRYTDMDDALDLKVYKMEYPDDVNYTDGFLYEDCSEEVLDDIEGFDMTLYHIKTIIRHALKDHKVRFGKTKKLRRVIDGLE